MKRNLYFILLGMMVSLFGCSQKQEYNYMEGKIYGTYYHISYESAEDLQTDITEQMESVNASLSMFNPSSVISKINRNETDSVDAAFCKMYRMSEKVNRLTAGAFDITVGPLANAWGFGFRKEVFPDSLRIDSLRKWVGMEKLQLNEGKLYKQFPQTEIDASSIAKGLGVDLVAEYLDHKKVKNYMVEIGGEVRVKGMSSKNRPWRIGIDRPEDDPTAGNRELQMVLGLTQGALATSGNYRNFYIHEGKKYAHTIDPVTGYPVQTEILSSSVYAPSCMEADAYATAFMVTGLEKAKKIVNAQPELEACFVYLSDGHMKVWVSEGLRNMIVSQSKGE